MSEMIERALRAYDTPTEPETGATDWGGPLPNRSARMGNAIAAFIGAASPDMLNRAGVPWTLEVAQALAALTAHALGETVTDDA